MNSTRSRLFTLICILAMLLGLAAAAAAQRAGHAKREHALAERAAHPDVCSARTDRASGRGHTGAFA